MSGTALADFTTFVASTGPAFLTGAESMINEAVKNTYTYARLARGHNVQDMVQGGSDIRDTVYFGGAKTASRYNPNAQFEYENPQTGQTWTIPWRFLKADVSWTDHEIGLNSGEMSRKAKFHRYKTLMRQKFQNLWTQLCNHMEEELWAQPSYADMEAASGLAPYSIPTFINEFADGLPGGSLWTGSGSTIQNINRATTSEWNAQVFDYTGSATVFGAGEQSLFATFSRAFHSTRFDRLPKKPEYSDKTTSPHFIAASLDGIVSYEGLLRANEDFFRGAGRQDPDYNNPMFRGVPLDRISELDTASVYAASANTFGDEDGASITGPRYYFINGEYMRYTVHRDRYFHMLEPFSPSKQPFTKVQVVDCWCNLALRSGQRHALVRPVSAHATPL